MSSSRNRSSKDVSPHRNERNAYPLQAYLDFVPGGINYGGSESNDPTAIFSNRRNYYSLNTTVPEPIVARARCADATLRKYALRFANQESQKMDVKLPSATAIPPHRLPSLSILAEAAFGPLTGIHALSVRKWADSMVLAYLENNDDQNAKESTQMIKEILAASDDELVREYEGMKNQVPPISPGNSKPSSAPNSPSQRGKDLISVLKNMHQKHIELNNANDSSLSPMPVRPCGYVFKKNDMAWNCRTCQTDSTCVICDPCFHASDHEGHEVYFHRTNPGGCCDCGDIEAWKIEGCCPMHRPRQELAGDLCVVANKDMESPTIENSPSGITDEKLDFEAVKASLRGRSDGEICVKEMLPPKFAAALGVVIGAALNSVIQAIDGSAIGADPVQWTRRWADQLRKIKDGRAFDEEYVMSDKQPSAKTISEATKLEFPNRFKLHLRLHNDDIHTYDEVTEALYRQMRSYSNPQPKNDEKDETDTAHGIVDSLDEAKVLTGRVDSEGQAVVKAYSTMNGAMAGFERMKRFGLHCAVLSSPQLDLEARARVLLSWLSDIAEAHPAVSALVVQALVDVTEGLDSLGGVYVWGNSRMIPPWSFSDGYLSSSRVSIQEYGFEDGIDIPGWRRRMDVFPPHLQSSFLTREESKRLHVLGRATLNETSSPRKGMCTIQCCHVLI